MEINNSSTTGIVTILPIKNTACIICGKAFYRERAGKLYCSAKCRQAGYYHKDKLTAIRNSQNCGTSREILTFSVKEYKQYCTYRDRIRNYRKLESHFKPAEKGSETWQMLYNSPNSALTWERKKIPEKIIDLFLPYLSIEQWSFLKSLYPEFKPVNLIEIVCSLSDDFLNQLTTEIEEKSKNKLTKYQPVRNKYLGHLNKIVNGEVKFV
ncbi:MAG TPA: hypothetical protein VGQ53_11415 [Chitinophagaceae bacterium]|jgi:hypothetical protein|nr:hypothetical protein [Chitinophagaceae bacterium]